MEVQLDHKRLLSAASDVAIIAVRSGKSYVNVKLVVNTANTIRREMTTISAKAKLKMTPPMQGLYAVLRELQHLRKLCSLLLRVLKTLCVCLGSWQSHWTGNSREAGDVILRARPVKRSISAVLAVEEDNNCLSSEVLNMH